MFADIIRDLEYVTLVVEDSFQSTENSRTGANITTNPDQPIPQPGESVIVGTASRKLQSGSARKGQFVDHKDLTSPTKPFYDGGLGRDKDKFHADLLNERYFANHALMDMVVVHPAYWRRGHGSALVKWSLALADMDDLKQGVIVAEMGERLYLSLDFTKLGTVQAQDEEQPPSRIEVGLLRYDPGQSGSREHVLKSDLNVSRLFKEEVWCGNWAK